MNYDSRHAEVYDELHAAKFEMAGRITEVLAGIYAGAGIEGRCLELGVGTGRLALPLAARGIDVHGIDLSEAMVARLRNKPGGAGVSVTTGNFAGIDDLIQGTFTLIYVADSTLFELASQQEQLRCFTGVARHLAPRGAFVVEAFAPDVTRVEKNLSVTAVAPAHVRLQASRHDPVTQTVHGQNMTLADDGVQISPWTIRYASVPELDLMAALAGLRLRLRWGGWDGQPFTASSSHHVSVYEPA